MNKQDQDVVFVLDFGGQYSQLIARRVREANVYSELLPFHTPTDRIKEKAPKGIILSGGPSSVYEEGAPRVNSTLFDLDIPILGICYGMQLMAHQLPGGTVERSERREYGGAELRVDRKGGLFHGLGESITSWMSHGDRVTTVPDGFEVIGHTQNSPVAAIGDPERNLYGVQFHPEVSHTPRGMAILKNFLFQICGCAGTWTTANFIEEKVAAIKAKVKNANVICGLSGGVDSSVAATLTHKAIGDQLTCIFVNHGLLRKNEAQEVLATFKDSLKMNVHYVDARERFYTKLRGVTHPEEKRKIIGEEFIRVFEEEAKKIGNGEFLVQGTIYSDWIESGGADQASTIKSHHNVGGLPEEMDLQLIEPLRELFKDEVRKVGKELGLPEEIVWRQPFPGPGLGIRIVGEVTPRKVELLQEADAILREEITKAGLNRDIWQYFAVLLPVRTVGVMGDERSYNYTVGVRAVKSKDAMTADWVRIPYGLLDGISSRITNEVPYVNRVVYDITSKPPATIEWE